MSVKHTTERTILGIDPGGRTTGLCVITGTEVLEHRTISSRGEIFPADRRYVLDVVAQAAELYGDHQPNIVAVETINRPSWHMNGRAAVDPSALLATAEILGAILGADWPIPIVQVRPNRNGSNPLGTYPEALISSAERRGKWQLRTAGKGQLCHARSAFDVARTGDQLHTKSMRRDRTA